MYTSLSAIARTLKGKGGRERDIRKTEQRVWPVQCRRNSAFVSTIIVSGHARLLCRKNILAEIVLCTPEHELDEHAKS